MAAKLEILRAQCDARLALAYKEASAIIAGFARDVQDAVAHEQEMRAVGAREDLSSPASEEENDSDALLLSDSSFYEEDDEDDEPEVLATPAKKRTRSSDSSPPPAPRKLQVGKRLRKVPLRFDPSRRRGDDDDRDPGEDINDNDDDDDEERELQHQLGSFRTWLGNVARARRLGQPMAGWADLVRVRSGWFANRYVLGKLEAVRLALGRGNAAVCARWDWVLEEALAGRTLPAVELRPGAISEQCALCGCVKMCTQQLSTGEWPMGYMCAKLARKWMRWCERFAALVRGEPDDALAALRSLDKAMDAVLRAHARKSQGVRRGGKQ